MSLHRVHLSDSWKFLHVPGPLQVAIGPITAERVEDIVHPLDRGVSRRRLEQHRNGKSCELLERRVVREDGRVTHWLVQSQPTLDGAIATIEPIVDPYEDHESARILLHLAAFCLRAGDVGRASVCVADALWLDRTLSWLKLERYFSRVLDWGPQPALRRLAERRQIVDLAMRLERLV
jgi:hypothetical protein